MEAPQESVKRLRRDQVHVAPFLEQRRDVDLIAAETFDALLRGLH